MLRFLFEGSGAVAQTATSAQAALEMIDVWQPDVLVSGLGMGTWTATSSSSVSALAVPATSNFPPSLSPR